MRGGIPGRAQHFRPGLREHHMRFNVDCTGRRKLASALATLNELNESVLTALDQDADQNPSAAVLQRMKAALRLLVEGPNGEFK